MCKRYKKAVFNCLFLQVLAIFILFSPVVGETVPDTDSPPVIKELTRENVENFVNNYVAEKMKEARVPGLEIGIVKGTEVLLSKGYGFADIEKKIPMTSSHAVRAGSVSKSVTATVVLQLAAKGIIDLDAPVSKYIKDLQLEDKYGPASTVAQLLTHEAGYDDTIFLSHSPTLEGWQPLGEMLAERLPERAVAPGKIFTYSDWGYSLLGYLIETVTEMPYEDAIQKYLLIPLDMNMSTYKQPPPKKLADALATGYSYNNRVIPYDFIHMSPGIALLTTADDMCKYMSAVLNNGVVDGTRVLAVESIPWMLKRQAGAHPYSRGNSYAFHEKRLEGRNVLYKDGNGIGFSNRVIMVPGYNLGIFLTTNFRYLDYSLTNITKASQFMHKLGSAILENFLPQSPKLEPTVSPLPDAAARAGRYAGHYHKAESPRKDFAKIRFLMDYADVSDNGNGTIRIGSHNYFEVEPLVFRHTEWKNFFVVFKENAAGEVEYLTFGGTGSYQKAKYYETKNFHFGLMGFMVLIFLSMVILWPIKRWGHWMAWLVGLINLIFFVAFALVFMNADYLTWYKILPLSTKITFILPWLSFVLTLSLPVFLVTIWRNSGVTLLIKGYYSLVCLAAFAFSWFAYFWNFYL
ncbi:MAG: serine hydrolase [bacterium]|nr:serine hydrolase [bacterium]